MNRYRVLYQKSVGEGITPRKEGCLCMIGAKVFVNIMKSRLLAVGAVDEKSLAPF